LPQILIKNITMSEEEPLNYFQSKGWQNYLKKTKNLSVLILAVSGIFITFNWPYGAVLLIIGLSSVMSYCFFKNLGQKPIMLVLSVCWGIFLMGVEFKLMHWPWANMLLLIGGVGAMIQSLLSMLVPDEVADSTNGIFDSKTFKNVMKYAAGLSKAVAIIGIVLLSFRWSGANEILIVAFSSLALTYLLGCLGASTLGQKIHGVGWSVSLMGLVFVWFEWPFYGYILPLGCVLLIIHSLLAALAAIED
jgi:hypothetical protein